jgi:hypothetical protein
MTGKLFILKSISQKYGTGTHNQAWCQVFKTCSVVVGIHDDRST